MTSFIHIYLEQTLVFSHISCNSCCEVNVLHMLGAHQVFDLLSIKQVGREEVHAHLRAMKCNVFNLSGTFRQI